MKPNRILMTIAMATGVGLGLVACQPEGSENMTANDATSPSANGSGSKVVSQPRADPPRGPRLVGAREPVGIIEIREGMPVALDVSDVAGDLDTVTGFASNAFPPTIPDTKWHSKAWELNDCLRCHETGVGNAPPLLHQGMPDILLSAQCRTCHVIEPGKPGVLRVDVTDDAESFFDSNAFPPMLSNSNSHLDSWLIEDCLMCHQDGTLGAPIIEHAGLPAILLKSKCRTCHVQVRSIEGDSPIKP